MFFYTVTGVSFMKSVTVLTALKELSIDNIASLIVSLFALFFWVSHYCIIKKRHKKEQTKLDLEIKLLNKKMKECK